MCRYNRWEQDAMAERSSHCPEENKEFSLQRERIPPLVSNETFALAQEHYAPEDVR
jgi:hypothetical protein